MSVTLPIYPHMPQDPGPKATDQQKSDYNNAQNKYTDDMARYNRTLQFIQQQQTEENATQSNMAKTRHDAMMAVISNMKA